ENSDWRYWERPKLTRCVTSPLTADCGTRGWIIHPLLWKAAQPACLGLRATSARKKRNESGRRELTSCARWANWRQALRMTSITPWLRFWVVLSSCADKRRTKRWCETLKSFKRPRKMLLLLFV